MPELERSGTRLFFEEAGEGDPPFVFVHGWTCNHSHFAPQLEHFETRHRVVGVDLRGHGKSDAPEQDYTVAGFADDVEWLCEQIGVGRPVLVGHSMGGTIVLDVAARFPQLPRAIVMIDAAPILATPELSGVGAGILASLQGPDHLGARTALIQHAVGQIHDDSALQARIMADMASVPQHVAVSCIEHMGAWDGEGAARACSVPTLHIAAAEPINDASQLRALNPLIRTGQTVGAGHFNQLEAPDQVNAMIERFLQVSL